MLGSEIAVCTLAEANSGLRKKSMAVCIHQHEIDATLMICGESAEAGQAERQLTGLPTVLPCCAVQPPCCQVKHGTAENLAGLNSVLSKGYTTITTYVAV